MSLRVISIATLLVFAATLARAEPDKRATVKELMTVGWNATTTARAKGEEAYDAAKAAFAGDRTVIYAYALVRMKQRQYEDATRLLDEYLAIEKSDIHAWRAKAWISMLTRETPRALAELDKLSQVLADEKVKVAEDERREMIVFVGRMLGFVEGPAEAGVNAATLEAAKRKIAGRLPASQQMLLEASITAVKEEYAVFATAKDDAQMQEVATAEKSKREQLTQFDQEESKITARNQELDAVATKITEEAQSENNAYAAADRPLAANVARLSDQILLVDRDLNVVLSDVLSLRAQAARERDPILRDQLLRESDRLDLLATRYDADLLALQRSLRVVQGQRDALAARHQQTLAGYAARRATAEKEFNANGNRMKRITAERTKLRKPVSGNTGKVISLNKQALALTTYETFPLEVEKQRVLDSLIP